MANALFLVKAMYQSPAHQVQTWRRNTIVPVSLTGEVFEDMTRADDAMTVAIRLALTDIGMKEGVPTVKISVDVMSSQIIP